MEAKVLELKLLKGIIVSLRDMLEILVANRDSYRNMFIIASKPVKIDLGVYVSIIIRSDLDSRTNMPFVVTYKPSDESNIISELRNIINTQITPNPTGTIVHIVNEADGALGIVELRNKLGYHFSSDTAIEKYLPNFNATDPNVYISNIINKSVERVNKVIKTIVNNQQASIFNISQFTTNVTNASGEVEQIIKIGKTFQLENGLLLTYNNFRAVPGNEYKIDSLTIDLGYPLKREAKNDQMY